MLLETLQPVPSQVESIYRLFSDLSENGGTPFHAENGLGGRLIWAGEIGRAAEDTPGRRLLFAANIAGAASLAASADTLAQREAIRDGAVDFFVTSLEEALRILKNEVRKKQAVSVGVALEPHKLVEQMLARGVLPDLLPPVSWDAAATGLTDAEADAFLAQGAMRIPHGEAGLQSYITWATDREAARWLPKLSLCAQTAIPAVAAGRQRWLRLAPRYLGRMAQRQHGVGMSEVEAALFQAQAKELLFQACGSCTQPTTILVNGEPITVS